MHVMAAASTFSPSIPRPPSLPIGIGSPRGCGRSYLWRPSRFDLELLDAVASVGGSRRAGWIRSVLREQAAAWLAAFGCHMIRPRPGFALWKCDAEGTEDGPDRFVEHATTTGREWLNVETLWFGLDPAEFASGAGAIVYGHDLSRMLVDARAVLAAWTASARREWRRTGGPIADAECPTESARRARRGPPRKGSRGETESGDDRGPPLARRAEDLIRSALADGPRMSADVLELGRRSGLSAWQIRAARARLGVRAVRSGWAGPWTISLETIERGGASGSQASAVA